MKVAMALAVVGWIAAGAAQAVVTPISATEMAPVPDQSPEPDTTSLVDFTVADLDTRIMSIGTVTAVDANEDRYFWAANGVDPGSDAAALSSRNLTEGRVNVGQVDYDLNATVDAGQGKFFFMYEISTNNQAADAVTVYPLSGGVPIGTWSLVLNPADYGTQTPLFSIAAESGTLPNVGARGTTFALTDFVGDVGTLTGVDGLRSKTTSGAAIGTRASSAPTNWSPSRRRRRWG